MSIIDLIQSCQLQLDPIPALETSFNTATDTFFTELEAQEAQRDNIRVRAAASLRTAIEAYRNNCATILSQYDTEMNLRRENENKAHDSVQVASTANEEAAKQQIQLVQIASSSQGLISRTLQEVATVIENQFVQQEADQTQEQTNTEAANNEATTESQSDGEEATTSTQQVIQEPAVNAEQQTTVSAETSDAKTSKEEKP